MSDFKTYRLINKKLRRPKSKIIAGIDFLPIARQFNCGFDHHPSRTFLSIDGITFAYYFDCVKDLHLGNDIDGRNHIDHRIGNGIYTKPHPNVIPSPWSQHFWHIPPSDTQRIDQRQGWCCIMSRGAPHRDMINDLIADCHSSMLDHDNFYQYDTIKNCQHDLTQHMMRPPGSKTLFFSQQAHQQYYVNRLGPWHDTALCELVTENSMDFFYPTEKTVKPIAAGMPFVMMSSLGFMKKLQKMGFRTFHPFIDESYDDIQDWRDRCRSATQSFFDFVRNPQHLTQIQKICDHNQQVLAQIQTHSWEDRVWKKIRRFIEF